MKFNTRQLVILAVFGALWGGVEIYLGSVLNALKIPLSGVVLSAIGLAIALIGRVFVPRRGATLFVGIIAMILKLFSIGNIVVGPMVAILAEALIAELVLSLSAPASRLSFILAGALGVLWSFVQPFVTGPVLFGRALIEVWLSTLQKGSQLFGLPSDAVWIILGIFAGLHLLVGGAAGELAWETGRLLHDRLRGKDEVGFSV